MAFGPAALGSFQAGVDGVGAWLIHPGVHEWGEQAMGEVLTCCLEPACRG